MRLELDLSGNPPECVVCHDGVWAYQHAWHRATSDFGKVTGQWSWHVKCGGANLPSERPELFVERPQLVDLDVLDQPSEALPTEDEELPPPGYDPTV